MKIALVVLGSCLLAACGLTPPSGHPSPPVETDATHWFRDSAEQRAIYTEIYHAAGVAAQDASKGLKARSWGVILDVDETVLDNSDYQKRTGGVFSNDTWNEWVKERKATVLPGADAFTRYVHDDLHGQVVLITNRAQSQCADTEANLHMRRVVYDVILCDATDPDDKLHNDKNPRFQQIEQTMKVVLWIGDNIQDFPHLTQASPGNPARFGEQYFALPNPMYGSWTSNPQR